MEQRLLSPQSYVAGNRHPAAVITIWSRATTDSSTGRNTELREHHVARFSLFIETVIPSDPTLLGDIVAGIRAWINRTGCWEDAESMGLAIRGALANAVVHCNHCKAGKQWPFPSRWIGTAIYS